MKSLTVIAMVLFVSCSNPKARIVEQIKAYKDSSLVVTKGFSVLLVNETLKYEELYFTNGRKDDNKYTDANRKVYEDYQDKNEIAKWDLKLKELHFKSKIDSLELELKKY